MVQHMVVVPFTQKTTIVLINGKVNNFQHGFEFKNIIVVDVGSTMYKSSGFHKVSKFSVFFDMCIAIEKTDIYIDIGMIHPFDKDI